MKYKVGDRVKIKSLDWYKENRDDINEVECGGSVFVPAMTTHCGYIRTISEVFEIQEVYHILEDNGFFTWTDEMIEGLVEETKPGPKFKVGDRVKWFNHTCDITSIDASENTHRYLISNFDYREDKVFAKWVPESELTFDGDEETKPKYEDEVTGEYYSTTKYLVRPNGYQFKDENGNIINATKIVLEKKKKEYPKTFVDCCAILYPNENFQIVSQRVKGHKGDLLFHFQKLLICRDAYWKIAGEEMGLGKPWSPTDSDYITGRYCIFVHRGNILCDTPAQDCVLTFPTEEMRDAFKENFDPDIELCKEFV